MVGRLASSVTNAFDVAPSDDAETVLPDWFKVKNPDDLAGVTVSDGVLLEALELIFDTIEQRGGEVFGTVFGVVRLNPYSVVVTMIASSPYFGVQTLGRVAFDPHEVKIIAISDGEKKIFLVDEYMTIWLAAIAVFCQSRS